MKKINFLIVLAFYSTHLFGQNNFKITEQQRRTGNFMAGIAFDAIKSDVDDRIGNKLQGGLEVNYFLQQNFSVNVGVEMWTGDESQLSGVAGIRFYPIKNIFLRTRGLIGVDDLAVGAGFQKILSEQWTAEGMFDYYLEGEVAARVGIAFLFVERLYREHN